MYKNVLRKFSMKYFFSPFAFPAARTTIKRKVMFKETIRNYNFHTNLLNSLNSTPLFIQHLLDYSNGEYFLNYFPFDAQQEKLENNDSDNHSLLFSFLSKHFNEPIEKLQSFITNEHFEELTSRRELKDALIEISLQGGAYTERLENSLANDLVNQTVRSWQEEVNELHYFDDKDFEFCKGYLFDLFYYNNNENTLQKENTVDLTEWLNSKLKFFNSTMWDKLLICFFKGDDDNKYIVLMMGVTDKE
ncbi:hypothetical protein ABK040_014447 [Willaertia magna]